MARAFIRVTSFASANTGGMGTNYLVITAAGVKYVVFIDRATNDVYYTKSTDRGLTWRDALVVRAGTVNELAVWYDTWSGISGTILHMAYQDANNIFYRSLDTASDTLGTETTVFTGVSSAGGGALTIWRSRGTTTIRVAGSIDNGAEDGAWSSTDSGATWGDTIADPSEGATQDQYYGLPGHNSGDANDEMLVFGDASANGLSVKFYDDSANSWSETTLIADASYVDVPGTNGLWANVACAVDLANSRNIVVAWTGSDTPNADLRCFFIGGAGGTVVSESAANVVLNSTDDQGLCAVGIDTVTGYIYVFYAGKSDGSETYASPVNIYYKWTTDDGATWSAETKLTTVESIGTSWLFCCPRVAGGFEVVYSSVGAPEDYLIHPVYVPAVSVFGDAIVR